jgi:SAM-dependent methyltransferase
MTGDAERWDEKYRTGDHGQGIEPDPFVLASLETIGPGAGRRALDLACGPGRHALYLAANDWRVGAWDVSPVGLEMLAERAGLEIPRRLINLTDEPAPDVAAYDLIVIVNYLDRDLLARMQEWLRSERPARGLGVRWVRARGGGGVGSWGC